MNLSDYYSKVRVFAPDGFVLALCAIAFFIPLRAHFANFSMGFAGFFWLILLTPGKWKQVQYFRIPLLVFSSIYILQIVGLSYSDNFREGLRILERKIPLVALPLLFFLGDIARKDLDRIFLAFIAGVFIADFYCFWKSVDSIVAEGLPLSALIRDVRFQNTGFSEHIPIHPAYLSSCIIISMLLLIKWFHLRGLWLHTGRLVLLVFFFVTILVLMSRASLFAIAGIISISVIAETIWRRKPALLVAGVAGIFVSAFLIFTSFPRTWQRVSEAFSGFEENVYGENPQSSVAMHYKSWYCATNRVIPGHLLFGFGTGDEQDVLNDCYRSNGWTDMLRVEIDAHNEYLSSLMRHGLFGMFALLAAFGYGAYLSFCNRNLLYLSFITLMAISALSESILRSQTPLLIYTFFNSCFFLVGDFIRRDEKEKDSPLTKTSRDR